MKIAIPLLMLLSLALTACTSSYQSVTQTADDGAYIRLSGNFMGTVMTINDGAPVQLTERHIRTFQLDNERVVLFEVKSGTQQLRITRDGTTLVHRELYVSDGNTVAVRVP
ncbi:hypothetical protein ACR0ST_11925 [Aliidiomarina sp. Khilg15.8]